MTDKAATTSSVPDAAKLGYEPSDASPRGILVAGGVVAVMLVLSLAAVSVWWWIDAPDEPLAPALGDAGSFTHGSDYRTSITQSWQHIETMEREADDYGWIDRRRGVVRLPIERAMQLVAEEDRP